MLYFSQISAGVGRTGTFIALDHNMNWISKHNPNDCSIEKTILEMRMDRNTMVQTKVI